MIDSMEILEKAMDYFKKAINLRLAQLNQEKKLSLELIQETDIGYVDILTGLREYPALLLLERKRVTDEHWFTRFSFLLGFAFKTGDKDLLIEYGQYYKDAIEWAIISDHTFGGVCLDSNDLVIDDAYTSDVYVVSAEFTADVRRGLPNG